jgi:hypothetical protein
MNPTPLPFHPAVLEIANVRQRMATRYPALDCHRPITIAFAGPRRDIASQLRRKRCAMKTAVLPSLRVDPALRQAAEEVLQEGESLSSFVEQSVRAQIEQRKARDEFFARGLASREKARLTGMYVASSEVVEGLASQLAKAKATKKAK